MKVRVKDGLMGYYGDRRRREGDVFEMADVNVLPLDDNGQPLVDRKGQPRVCSWIEPVNAADLEKLLAKYGKKVAVKQAPKAEAPAPAPAQEKEEDDAL